MIVHAMVTSLIVFKILKVFLGVKPTSESVAERTLGLMGGTPLQYIIFLIIEPGTTTSMMLFVIQLQCFVFCLGNLPSVPNGYLPSVLV
jgi:hypothetical protein